MEDSVTIHIFISSIGTMTIGSFLFIKAGHSIGRIISNSLLMLVLSFIPIFLTLIIWGVTNLPTVLLAYAFPLSIFLFFYVFTKSNTNHQNETISNDSTQLTRDNSNTIKNQHKTINSITPLPAEQAQLIIQEHSSFMEEHAPTPGCVADANKLPYPKETIKNALITALQLSTDKDLSEILKASYIFLADWQENVGEINQGIDVTNLDLNADPKILAENILAHKAASDKWSPIIQAEQQALSDELSSMGF